MDMKVFTQLIDYREYYDKYIVEDEVLWVNDLDFYSDDDKALLGDSLYTKLKSHVIPITPSCRCGNLEVGYLRGSKCEICNTIVDNRFGDLRPTVWIHKMENSAPFLSQYFVASLTMTMGNNTIQLVRWFGNRTYKPSLKDNDMAKVDMLIEEFHKIPGFTRSYAWLVDNMEMVLLTVLRFISESKSRQMQYLINLWRKHKDKIVTDILPVINKHLIIVETTSKGSYIKESRADIVSAVEVFLRYKDDENEKMRDKATAEMIQTLADMYLKITTDLLSKKEGLMRKDFMGARLHFSFRQVLTPINGKHMYDELHMPWQSAVVTMRPMIVNKLYKRGYSIKEINNILFKAIVRYDKLIDDILKELIAESGEGIPVMVHRNPSQNSASINLVRMTKVKSDPEDKTLSLSTLMFVFMNADIDGDEINATLVLDRKLANLLTSLRPENDVLAASNSYANLFGKVSLPEASIATLTYRIESERNRYKTVKGE